MKIPKKKINIMKGFAEIKPVTIEILNCIDDFDDSEKAIELLDSVIEWLESIKKLIKSMEKILRIIK